MSASSDLVVALAQIDVLVGDVEGNAQRALEAASAAADAHGARLVVLPELSLLGYPPDDLLLRPDLPERIDRGLAVIADRLADSGVAVLVGAPQWQDDACYNSAVLLDGGERVAAVHKRCLPNYGVFDEKRYFAAGRDAGVATLDGHPIGILVCEDLWEPEPAAAVAAAGAEAILCINASPFHWGKHQERREVARDRVRVTGLPLIYLNQVGGQDDLVFDGDSFALNAAGEEVAALPALCEADGALALVGGDIRRLPSGAGPEPRLEASAAIYRALVLAIRDYVDKNGFGGVFVGLSGGIDSALVLALAADALGPDRVGAALMPSRYTAQISVDDAADECRRLGVAYHTLSIEKPCAAFSEVLSEVFAGLEPDVTEENIQARARGLMLMALANKRNWIVLATGNKSEMAVGYATLYGDMAGGFAPLKDVSKIRVYELARWRNSQGEVIPQRVIERPPTAELAEGQADTDNLPPYEVLDPILEALVERDDRVEDIVAAGYDEATVRKVAGMLLRSEYKRRQAAPGPKVSPRAFGRERRYPITSGYRF
ncbi:MAG: NAD+ synthase [Halofilum sp. (in: g-proteobacteria)]